MAIPPEDASLNVATNHEIPGLRRMSVTPTSRALRAQRLRKRRQTLAEPVTTNSSFGEGSEGWEEETTGNDSGSANFGTIGQVVLTATLLGGIRLIQSGILSPGATYRLEIDVSAYVAGPLILFNGGTEIDIGVTATGTYVVEFVAESFDFVVGLKLGLARALTCTAIRVLRHG